MTIHDPKYQMQFFQESSVSFGGQKVKQLCEVNIINSRGMVTLKCCGSEINNFLFSSFRPTPEGPA